jgi:hypothetical protein
MAAPMMRSAGFGGSSPTTTKPTASPEPVMPTLPENMSAAAPSSPPSPAAAASMDYLDEFSQFDQTFGSYENNKNDDNSNSNSDNKSNADNTDDTTNKNDSSSTLWDVMLSLYLPVLLLWLRRSMFGTANLIRSLILGHFLRLFFGNLSGWMSENAPSWLAVTLQTAISSSSSQSSGGAGGAVAAAASKLDQQQWPPPAFVALALLTVFTLVVHPDGFTWIMLGKLR